jgi:DNA-binding ferritin-like protein (Dps family)
MRNLFKTIFQKNELDMLIKENKLRTEYLSVENRLILKKIIKCISASRLSSFDIQIYRKDFIGMALEAEQSGNTLNDVIGNDMHSFCKELIANGSKRTLKESLILSLPHMFLVFTLIYGIYYIFMYSCPPIIKITLSDLFFYLIWCLLGVEVASYYINRSVFNTPFKKGLTFLIRPATFVLLIVLSNFFYSKHIILTEIIGWVPFVVAIMLLLVFSIFRSNYLNHIARNYNWRD